MSSVLNEAYFHNEAAAFEALETLLWPNGPTCPHCGATDRLNRLKGVRSKPSKKHPKGIERHGLWKCYHCLGQFTVRKGTVFESSHLKLHQWFQAAYLLCSSKKGVSSNQLARTLGVTVKTAWFASHRLREAMREGGLIPLGGVGKIVEVDETFLHDMDRFRGETFHRGTGHKRKVLTLIERGGDARSFHIEDLAVSTVAPIVRKNIARETALTTDEARHYTRVGKEFASHESVEHRAEEYVRGRVHVNTAEGFFSLFKRGMKGIYQHCGEKHLHRYLAEFDFRYNNRIARGIGDTARTDNALRGIVGKRLKYRDSSAERALS